MSNCAAVTPSLTRRRPLLPLSLALLLAACGRDPTVPDLPGVVAGEPWFWREVLAAPLPGEAPPRLELLRLPPIDPTVPAVATGAASAPDAAPVERLDALVALVDELGADALTTLMAALRDERPAIAMAAAHELGRLGLTAAIPRLLKGIGPYPVDHDPAIEVRLAQASALARLGNPAGVPLILAALAEKTDLELPDAELPWTRSTRAAFLQEIALEGLVALAGEDFGYHPSASVPERTRAAAAARAWWDARRIALWAAAPIEGEGCVARVRLLVAHLDAYQLRQIDGARFALAHLGPAVIPFLEEGLRRDDAYVRLHVLEVLERLADVVDEKTRGRLAILASGPLLEDPDVGIAAQAARVCGTMRVADPLVVALGARAEGPVRVAIVDALRIAQRPAAAAAVAALADPPAGQPDLQAALAAARFAYAPLPRQDERARLLALLASPDTDVAFAALQRVGELLGGDAAYDPLDAEAARTPALEQVARRLQAWSPEPSSTSR